MRLTNTSRLCGMAALGSVVTVLSFVYGLSIGRYEVFPFEYIRYVKATYLVEQKAPTAKDVVDDNEDIFTETVLLPLKYHDFKRPSGPARGSLSTYRDDLLLVDGNRMFQLFDVDDEVFRQLNFPDVPISYESDDPKRGVDLRIYDILLFETATQKRVLVSHESLAADHAYSRMTISSLGVDDELRPLDGAWRRIFSGSPIEIFREAPNAGGGRMVKMDDTHIMLSTGDYALDGMTNVVEGDLPSQDDTSSLGKMIVIDIAGSGYEMVSMGHRNPQGLLVSSGGIVYSTEHGPKGGDELNIIEPGGNYGWPLVSYGVDYGRYDLLHNAQTGRHDGYRAPLFSWVPSIATSAIAEIGNFHERWNGDLLIGSLKARSLYRVRLHEGAVSYVEPIWIGGRVRDLEVTGGKIFVWLDAQILRVVEAVDDALKGVAVAGLGGLDPNLAQCLGCHHLGRTNSSHPAPSLAGVLSRPIGSDPGFEGYSSALKKRADTWNREKLAAFVKAPATFAPGTSMPALADLDDVDILNIVEGLGAL